MRKLFLALALMACTFMYAATTVQIGDLYYSLGTTTASVVADQSSGKTVYSEFTSVTIPASVTYDSYTYPVTSIGTSAFEALTKLQTVVLPSSITVINTDAFYGCNKLGSINLPEGLETIYKRAFYNCALTSVTIPSTVTSIGAGVFKGNPLTSVTWLPANCSIGTDTDAPFYNCTDITSFTFGDKVETVPAYLCKNMSKIETIVLPPSVHSLGVAAFMNCSKLKSINLPATQKTIPTSFLEGCISLESIELPTTLTTINQDAFYGCTKLANVNLHEGLEAIYQRAFYNCALTSVTIPSTMTSIGSGAFKGNPLTSVTWLPANCSIGTDTDAPFYNCTDITSFTFGDKVETVPAYLCKNMSKIETIVLPPSVHSLGVAAFMNCSKLKSINLPVTQKTLPTSFLEGCISLESIELPTTLTTINQDAFYGCTKLANVNLHEGLEAIYQRAFYNCALTSVTIPSTMTSIGSGAFKGNPLTSVTWLPANCSIGTDTDAPFYNCTDITSFTFGDKVETVPAYLCKNMSKIETIVLPPSVHSLGVAAFMNCSKLKSINLPVTQKTLPTSFLEGCTSLESIELPTTLTTINQDAFYGCTKLANVNLHEGLEAIYQRAFYNCALTSVTIPSTMTSIGSGAFKSNPLTSVTWLPANCSIGTDTDAPFYNCTDITSFTFGDQVEKIPAYLCKNMSKLEAVIIPESVKSIGLSAFMNCSKLTSFEFPEGVVTVATSILEGCIGLKTLIIPSSVSTINQDAFYNCSKLEAIYNHATTPQTITQRTVNNVDKTKCSLYVPAKAYGAYVAADVWREFLLKELPTIYYEFSETACDSYTWNDKTYTVSQDVVETFRSVAGLDSVVTLHLTINHSSAGEEYQTAEGSYTWHDMTYTESGDYTFLLTNVAGCDSIATLHLTVIPLWEVTVQQPANGVITIQETGIDLTKVKDGTLLHFIATPDEGYIFEAWSGCNEDGSLLVNANATVTCSFKLDPTMAIDPVRDDTPATKILRDGNLLILRGDKTYTVTGKEVK